MLYIETQLSRVIKSSFVGLIIMICSWVSSGQNTNVDSLKLALNSSNSDTASLSILLKLSTATSDVSIKESKYYAEKALKLSKKVDDNKQLIKSLFKVSFCLDSEGKLDSSLLLCREAVQIAKTTKDSLLIGHALYRLGVAYTALDEKDKASENLYKSIEIAEAVGDSKTLINTYNGLGTLLIGSRDETKATEYFRNALTIARQPEFNTFLPRQLINLAIAIDDHTEQEDLLDEAYEWALKLNNQRALSYIFMMYSHLYKETGEFDKATIKLREALSIANKSGDLSKVKETYLDLGNIYIEQNMLDSAEYYFEQFLNDTTISTYAHGTVRALKSLSKVQHLMGKDKLAYGSLDSSYTLAIEQYDKNVKDKLAEANAKYETEKKDAELAKQKLELLTQENQKRNLIGGGIILLLLSGFLFFRYSQKQKLKKKEAELALKEKENEANALREIDEMKTQFFTNISHELRTPLTLIKGPLENVLEKGGLKENEEAIALAYKNSDRLLDMINEIMDLSKLQSGNISLNESTVDINQFIKRVFFAFQSMAEIRNVQLVYEEKVQNALIRIDEDKLEKILNNLISNGLKYSPSGSQLLLTTKLENDSLEVKVVDEGKGIHPADLDKIFNRYFQSSLHKSSEEGGTGVGLALAKELTTLFKGTLNVENNETKGCTFRLSIPVYVSGHIESDDNNIEPDQEKMVHYQPILINGEQPHILIIEDNEEMQQYIRSLLKEDYRCSFAQDGYKALQMLQKNRFDLISSDIMMPLMDGFQLKEKVNQIKGLNHIPFIFLSARALDEDILKGLRLGVDDYITKPFNKYEYIARIYNLLKNKQEREANEHTSDLFDGKDNVDEATLKNAEKSILSNLSNPNYKVIDLANDLNYSQRQLTRVIKNLTGLTPVNLILEIRLQKSYQMLKANTHHSVSEVMYDVGIESASYFARKFKERFGLSPGEV